MFIISDCSYVLIISVYWERDIVWVWIARIRQVIFHYVVGSRIKVSHNLADIEERDTRGRSVHHRTSVSDDRRDDPGGLAIHSAISMVLPLLKLKKLIKELFSCFITSSSIDRAQ